MNLLDEKVVSMQVQDSGEPLVKVPHSHPKLVLDHSVDLGYDNQFIARESVVYRLLKAAEALPDGVLLSLKETYRPLKFQAFIFQRRRLRLQAMRANGHLTEGQLLELTSQFIAPPEVAGHPTGGAVDVTLVDVQQKEMDMGCKYDEDEAASNGFCFSQCTGLTEHQTRNRNRLFDCMQAAGFVNYPYEWWHWSYGDKYWAAVAQKPHAIYSAVCA